MKLITGAAGSAVDTPELARSRHDLSTYLFVISIKLISTFGPCCAGFKMTEMWTNMTMCFGD